ncbi:MAG: class I SAM-dependent methyltransferase [Candidatus Latescibacterota bacterium]
MEWYKRWFGEEYLIVYEHRDTKEAEREVEFVERVLELKNNDLILDLCCGSGRHDHFLTQKGYRVIGLDYSLTLLRKACNGLHEGVGYPHYILADARVVPFCDGIFDAVLNLFTSFGYFEDRENLDLLKTIARLLKNGGKFYIDYLNPQKIINGLFPETVKKKNGLTVVEKRHLDTTSKRVEKTIIIRSGNGENEFHESVRLYSIEEMLVMLKEAGLIFSQVCGSIRGEEYNENSDRMIIYGWKSNPIVPI